MESISEVLKEPIVPFAVLLVVILAVPSLFEKLRLPGLVGLLVAGVLLGPNGLQLLNTKSETMSLLSDIGLVYLMFVAGLEVDMEQFRRTKNRSMGFGSFTFAIPLIMGTLVGRLFDFDWNASILIGSLFASHTLLAYPIVRRLGVVNNEAVTVTIGATIFTDIGALLVLAICIAIHDGEFSPLRLAILIGSLMIYSAAILFGFDWLGKEFFRRSKDDQGNQFLFVLLALFLASVGAQLIGVEKIIGAFLAGLAVNDVVGNGPVKEKVEFVGSVLFIPIFFVDLGLLIDIPAFIKSISTIQLTAAIVVGLIVSKLLAAVLAKLVYRYNGPEMMTMWSLSMPQVGATLAATLVGYRAGVLNEGVLNSVIVLMLVTSTLGPILTSRFAPQLDSSATALSDDTSQIESPSEASEDKGEFTVVVPVYNPQTQQYLIEMATLLARHEQGQIVPLAIARAHAQMNSPEMNQAIQKSKLLLDQAKELSRELGVEASPQLRIDYDVAQGISHASRELNASLVVLGLSGRLGIRARLFGNVTDSVLWSSHCLVAVTRLLNSPLTIQRILVPVENITTSAVRPVRFAQILADVNQAQVTLLHVCDPRTSPSKIAWTRSQLQLIVSRVAPQSSSIEIEIKPHESITRAILNASQSQDLVVLQSLRRRSSADGLAMGEVTTPLLRQLSCSIVLLGEAPESPLSVLASS
ncbi:MAG TPA: cation:proton antiporter [Coleofasciculaceae cyanobacterium]|jgi:Kef-type K+ transport system membrane component KefB/nucleotide-binding universal stress UspA family protein